MAFDEGVAQRLREAIGKRADVSERRMFGGLAFMLSGHMCCGVLDDRLMVRVGREGYAHALARPHAHEMDFTGKPLTGFVYVDPTGFENDDELDAWVRRGLDFVTSLPPK